MDAHATLGVPPSVTLAEARRAYRIRLRAVHPDTGIGDAGAIAAVRTAYRELERRLRAEATKPEAALHVDVYA